MSKYWEIEDGKIDSTEFFRVLPTYFPEATTFYVEGTPLSDDVIQCYKAHSEEGEYLPRAEIVWPKSGKYRCKFPVELMEELASLSERHAEPEMLDHMFLYKNEQVLLEWTDAFLDPILVSQAVTEKKIRHFAAHFNLEYKAAE